MAKRSLSRMTATTSTVSSINQTAIVKVLRDHGPMSRVRIGELTGLSPATVNRLTVALLEQGVVVRDGQEPSTGGRPSLILRYTGGPRVVAGVQLRGDRINGALIDFGGNVIDRQEQRIDRGTGVRTSAADVDRLEMTLGMFDLLLARSDELGRPCAGVGVSVPGVVSEPDGRIGFLAELGWPELPLGEVLRAHTTLPVVIENDANALAYGEFRRGAGVGVASMVALLLDNGMGAGIITNGAVHRGRHCEAGEIGYLLMERSSLRRSYTDS
ncbi:MAG: ROK family protein, partial [Nocardioidaceae bacterium]